MKRLPYAYDALEPGIWSQVVFIHYERHMRDGFNRVARGAPSSAQAATSTIEQLVRELSPTDPLLKPVTDYYSHYLHWLAMSPTNCPHAPPEGQLMQAINATWGSMETLQGAVSEAANTLYEAGWVFVCVGTDGLLRIQPVAEDDQLVECVPLLALDLWEHSYYLQYLSSKAEYVNSWWGLVDWDTVEMLYEEYVAKGEWVPV